MQPGLGLKRWLALIVVGLTIFGIGIGFATAIPLSPKVLPVIRAVTLTDLHYLLRGLLFSLVGFGLIAIAISKILRLVASSSEHGSVDILTSLDLRRRRRQGSNIVAIGGGTGLSTLLRGLKLRTTNLTAIVTMTDDGGSSGQLRNDLHMPPPGDIRNCLVSLSETEPLLANLFNYRFEEHGSSLDGHSVGNLLLAALYEMHGGFKESLQAATQLLRLAGRVLPVCEDSSIVLMGETTSGQILKGESTIGTTEDQLHKMWIEPTEARASDSVLEAFHNADMIVIGPGSLYTSVIPNFLIPGVTNSMERSQAPKVFVCNVATQPYETDGYGAFEHLTEFQKHTGAKITHILINNNVERLPADFNQSAVSAVNSIDTFDGTLILADLVDTNLRTRHDPLKLADALWSIREG